MVLLASSSFSSALSFITASRHGRVHDTREPVCCLLSGKVTEVYTSRW